MENRKELGKTFIEELEKNYTVRRNDIGSDARLSKSGMTFNTESYTVEGLGHLCVLNMKAMLGLMKMETVVLSSFEKDVPLINLDWVGAFGKETQISELYDTQLTPYPQEKLDELQKISDADSDIEDYSSGPAWYDEILYPCSYHKTGKGISGRLSASAERFIKVFADQLQSAESCDAEAKKARISDFANTLVEKGGPAVNQFTKLFGRDTAERLILGHMYGVK